MSAEQARQWRHSHPSWSIWTVVFWQCGVGLALTGLVALLTQRQDWTWSVLYGAAAVVLPAAVLARGVTRVSKSHAVSVLQGFFLWEMVKMVLCVAMLVAAPRVWGAVVWPGVLLGLVVTSKVYWLALFRARKMRKQRTK